jgi:hypothetical protein
VQLADDVAECDRAAARYHNRLQPATRAPKNGTILSPKLVPGVFQTKKEKRD